MDKLHAVNRGEVPVRQEMQKTRREGLVWGIRIRWNSMTSIEGRLEDTGETWR